MQYLNLLFVLLASFLVTIISMPFIDAIAFRVGAVDVPNDSRRMHKNPIPRLGGLAMFYGFIVGVLCFAELTAQVQGIIYGLLIIVTLGVIDDIKPIDAKIKFLIQIFAALVVAYFNVRITFFSVPEFINPNKMIVLSTTWSYIISIIWIVGITNALNLIDGIDGLAGGVTSIAAISFLLIAVIENNIATAVLAAALIGSCFGFLPYNMHPAKVFMGDTGATFLGFTMATLMIMGLFKSYAVITFAIPFLVLGLPIFDTSFAIVRRLIKRQSIMVADRGHLHHRLIDMGFNIKQTVLILYAISALLGLAAITMASSGTLKAALLIGSVVLFVVFGTVCVTNKDQKGYIEVKEDNTNDEN